MDLSAPYLDDCLSLKAHRALIALAAAAWNLTLLPERERTQAFREVVAGAAAKDRDAVADILMALIQRKEQLFPEDQRTIVGWEVSELADEYHVNVASITVD